MNERYIDVVPPDYFIAETDIFYLPIIKHLDNPTEKQIEAILYLLGMDVEKGYNRYVVNNGEIIGYRSLITGEIVKTVHVVYEGFERKDKFYKEYGAEMAYNLLCTDDGIDKFLSFIGEKK